MKKIIILLAFVVFAVEGFSQNLKFIDGNKEDVSGTTVDISTDVNSSVVKAYYDLVNTGMDTIKLRVKKTIISAGPGITEVAYCFAGACLPPEASSSPILALAPGDTTTNATHLISEYYPHDLTGACTVAFTAYDTENPNDSVMIINVFDTENDIIETSSNLIDFSLPYPNPANEYARISYSLKKQLSSSMQIISLSGVKMKTIDLENQSGNIRIDTQEFDEGIYLYSFLIEGNIVCTHKLLVQH